MSRHGTGWLTTSCNTHALGQTQPQRRRQAEHLKGKHARKTLVTNRTAEHTVRVRRGEEAGRHKGGMGQGMEILDVAVTEGLPEKLNVFRNRQCAQRTPEGLWASWEGTACPCPGSDVPMPSNHTTSAKYCRDLTHHLLFSKTVRVVSCGSQSLGPPALGDSISGASHTSEFQYSHLSTTGDHPGHTLSIAC